MARDRRIEPEKKRTPRELKTAFETYVRATQGNFDHLSGQAREFARQFNLLAGDVATLYEALGLDPDDDGAGGTTGATGPAGADGPIGAAGPSGGDGSDGPPGPPGAPGDDGEPGPPGPPGRDGTSGTSGSAGVAGPPGFPGDEGDVFFGVPGLPGVDGTFTAGAPEDSALVIFRADSGNNAQLERIYLIDADPPTEETDLTGGSNYTIGFEVTAADTVGQSAIHGQTDWIVATPVADPDYWGVTHAANTVLQLEEGVYVYQMNLGFDAAAAVADNEVYGGFEYAEDPSAISPFAEYALGPNNTLELQAGVPTSRTGYLFTGEFVVPTGGAKYVFNFGQPSAGGTELRRYNLLLAKAAGAGAAGTDGLSTQVLDFSSTDPPVDGDQAPSYFLPYDIEVVDVRASGEARANAIDVDILKNGVTLGWVGAGANPQAPLAGGVGTARVPDTTAFAEGDELTVNLDNSIGTGRIIVYIKYETT